MKKIYLSILAIVLTVGMVSGAAYALFNDTVAVSGLTVTTGNADLKVNGDDSSTNGLGFSMQDIYPGWMDGKRFYLTNKSQSDISLDLSTILSTYTNNTTSDYHYLKDQVSIAILEYSSGAEANTDLTDGIPGNTTNTHNTGWKTLAEWKDSSKKISSSPLAKDAYRYYIIWAKVDSGAGNEIAEKNLTTNFVITGEQHL